MTKYLANEIEVSCVNLSHKPLCFSIQVTGPNIGTPVRMKNVVNIYVYMLIAMLQEHLIHRMRETPAVNRECSTGRSIKVLCLWNERTIMGELVVICHCMIHHLLHSSIDVATFIEV